MAKDIIYDYNGKKYTINRASRVFGISEKTLRKRLNSGMTFKEAVETPVEEDKTYTYKGKEYTVAQAAKEFGIDRTTLCARLDSGIPFEEAIKPAQRPYNGENYTRPQDSMEF